MKNQTGQHIFTVFFLLFMLPIAAGFILGMSLSLFAHAFGDGWQLISRIF